MQAATATSIYEELGVKPVINARGNQTVLGGSTPSPRARAAADQAERYFVDMKELLAKTGEIIAGLLGVEAAYITPGAAAAMALGTAACVTGPDLEKMAQLPDTTGLKNRVVMQHKHQYSYMRAPTIVGPKLHFVGDESGTSAEQLEAALGPDVANVLFPAHLNETDGTVPIDQVIEIAHRKDVRVLIDAAGQIYPLDKFRWWAQKGDLVAIGAKYFGGFNSSGLLVGKKELIDAAVPQGFIGFETVSNRKGFGRPLKLDRQEIVGVTVALQEWFSMDHGQRLARLEQRLGTIQRQVQGLPGVTTELLKREGSSPRLLRIAIDAATAKRDADAVVAGLSEGNPAILVSGGRDDAITLTVHTVVEGDEEIIARRLRELLS
jgi:L-seryl-tRNA(Ser) seleniumtransferase